MVWREMSYRQECFKIKTNRQRLRDEYVPDELKPKEEFSIDDNEFDDTDFFVPNRHFDFLLWY